MHVNTLSDKDRDGKESIPLLFGTVIEHKMGAHLGGSIMNGLFSHGIRGSAGATETTRGKEIIHIRPVSRDLL